MNTAEYYTGIICTITGLNVSCSINEDEKQLIVQVYSVPRQERDHVRHTLYELESMLFPKGDGYIVAMPYTEEETREYFPERIHAELVNPVQRTVNTNTLWTSFKPKDPQTEKAKKKTKHVE